MIPETGSGPNFEERLDRVGQLVRVETEQVVIAYHFDLTTNLLMPQTAANPTAGAEHRFTAKPEQILDELTESEDAAEGDEQ